LGWGFFRRDGPKPTGDTVNLVDFCGYGRSTEAEAVIESIG
jgi:hypothetical protein